MINRDLGLNLEIKPCPGREKDTAEIALDVLSHYWDNHDGLLISSFEHVSLEAALDVAADWSRGLLLGGDTISENWLELADYLHVKTINFGTQLVTPEIIATTIEQDYIPLVYTVNEPHLAREYQSMGVKTVFSDEPDLIEENMLSVH